MKALKMVLYKYGIQTLCIVLEILGIIYFFGFLAHYAKILWVLAYITNYVAFISVVNKKKNPEFKIPWISIILLIPLFGTLMYGMFYSRKMSKKEIKHFRKLENEYKYIIENKNYKKEGLDILTQGKINNLLHDDYLAQVYTNTTSKYYALGEKMFEDMLNDLKNAKEFIFLEYFIVEKGFMWDSILKILTNKVKEGVEVRMLYDDIGCTITLPRNYDKQLRKLGIKCYKFNKFSPKASCIHNNRDHRKILVIDGKVGYTGGINLADEYINKVEKHGHWKDGGIRIEGQAVNGLTRLFILNADVNNKTITDYKRYERNYKVNGSGIYIPFGSGPEPLYKNQVGENVFLNIINQAQKYVYITTPYLIIDYSLCESLKKAAIRGVDVKIITPHIPDKKIIHLTTRSFYNELIEAGVKIYEYKNGFIHAKTILSDDKYGVIGTINFDYRSLVHHYENAVFMYETDILCDVKIDINNTIKISNEMKVMKVSFAHRTILSLIRLFITML